MEAKELEGIVASAELRNPKVFNASRERYVIEISFKAGIREMVEFIQHREKNYSHTNWGDTLFRQDILAKLKEWGL